MGKDVFVLVMATPSMSLHLPSGGCFSGNFSVGVTCWLLSFLFPVLPFGCKIFLDYVSLLFH